MKIGEIAKASRVSIETIRYYEKYGLISAPPRTGSGYRDFLVDVIGDLQFIKRAKRLGFSLEEIKKLLAVSRNSTFYPEELYHFTMDKVHEVEKKIQELKSMKKLLEELAINCPRAQAAKADCPIIQQLEGVK
ncbi:heavy metal-responsive transcriptional regulator [Planococcus lenghuensis]|uniref:HTH merR-type domain-containing protein n=1 Tax=Planococcus lenghuensis TaxID=2213202 RepID=A0A1Q2KYJ2_9BACL|nr:heavy metal-responsive transcriptional regulator [Planococcus lenghuensis]AQQ53223.1 hypothetical protein B0X71_09120 [Planococcus lenghuensis]